MHAEAPAQGKSAVTAKGTIRMEVILDRDMCQSHAACVGEAPEVFQVGEDGRVALLPGMDRPPAALHEKVRLAAKHCPTRTIRLVESETE